MTGRVAAAVVVEAVPQREHTEDHRDDGLTDELRPRAQAEVALPEDLDEVVEEADQAVPTKRKRSSHALALGAIPVKSRAPKYPSTVASTITTPPMVGVPRLDRCVVGPSSRISWP